MNEHNPQFDPQAGDPRALVSRGDGDVNVVQRSGGVYPYYPQYGTETPEAPRGFDFYKHVRTLLKYRWLIVSIVGTALLAALVITFLMTPIYRATSSIQIDRETVNVTDVKDLQSEKDSASPDFYQTKYELLLSRSLASKKHY